MAKRYGIWSIKTKGWVCDGTYAVCTYPTKKAAKAAIKADLVHEKDYLPKLRKER